MRRHPNNVSDSYLNEHGGTRIQTSRKAPSGSASLSSFRDRVSIGYYDKNPDDFKNDLLEFFEIKNHPKANKVYSLAYERGHSCGYSEVLNEMYDLVELIRD